MTRLALIQLLLLASLCHAGDEDKKLVYKEKLIEVKLWSSSETLDPLKPGDHHLKCIVRNVSDRAVEVPTFYSGGYDGDLKLQAAARWELTLVRWAGVKKKEHKKLQPGEEVVVFKDTLRQLFLLDVKDPKSLSLKPQEERHYWSWTA